ncbi:MAG: microviridin/marinostatin family tricyclic proteinase inhibitor [Candidatus Aminicenantes bacterium]
MAEQKIILPYFARFLEGDVKKEELKNIKGGAPTHKFPSDRDEAQEAQEAQEVQFITIPPLD